MPTRFLADFVDVALDRADDHLADLRRAGLGQQRPQDEHAAFIALAASSTSGTNRMPSRKSIPTIRHALDQRLCQRFIGSSSRASAGCGPPPRSLLEAVIEVVMHLLNEVVVVQAVEIEFRRRHSPWSSPVLRNLCRPEQFTLGVHPASGAGRRVPGEARIGKTSTRFPTVAAAPPRHVLKRARQGEARGCAARRERLSCGKHRDPLHPDRITCIDR